MSSGPLILSSQSIPYRVEYTTEYWIGVRSFSVAYSYILYDSPPKKENSVIIYSL